MDSCSASKKVEDTKTRFASILPQRPYRWESQKHRGLMRFVHRSHGKRDPDRSRYRSQDGNDELPRSGPRLQHRQPGRTKNDRCRSGEKHEQRGPRAKALTASPNETAPRHARPRADPNGRYEYRSPVRVGGILQQFRNQPGEFDRIPFRDPAIDIGLDGPRRPCCKSGRIPRALIT